MAYGVTDSGFSLKRLQDIKRELEAKYRDIFGDIRTDSESTFGQIIGVQAEGLSLIWEQLQSIYDSMYPNSAKGISLDNVLQLSGLTRLPATRTNVLVGVDADDGTTVPSTFKASDPGNDNVFLIKTSYTINYQNLANIVLRVTDVEPGDTYSLKINGIEVGVTNAPGQESDIAEALKSDIDGKISDVETVLIGGRFVHITGVLGSIFSVEDLDAKLTLFVNREFDCTEAGSIVATFGKVNNIFTPQSGVNEVFNFFDGLVGREIETDEQARIRREESFLVAGVSTVEAIRSRVLQNVEGVTAVNVIENTSLEEINSLPGKSFETIVIGGQPEIIARQIFSSKPAGIYSHGSEGPFTITDTEGNLHFIRFSRPEQVLIYFGINLTLSQTEVFPDGGLDLIKEEIVRYGKTLRIGQKVVWERFFAPIHRVQGILSADFGVSKTETFEPFPSDLSPYKETIIMQGNEIAVVNVDNIKIGTVESL